MKIFIAFLLIFSGTKNLFPQESIDEKVNSFFNKGEFGEIILLKDSIERSGVDETIYKLAISYFDGKNYADALKYFNIVIGKDSSAMGSYLYASKSLDKLGQEHEALKIIEAGIRHHEDKSFLYCQKAELLNEQGEFNEAETFFIKAIKLDEKNPRPYYKLGAAYYSRNKIQEAVKILEEGTEKCEKENWEFPVLLDVLGSAYYRTEQYGKSNDIYIELLKSWKDDPYTLSSIVQNYFALSLYDFAKKYQDELYKLYAAKKIPKDMNDEYCFDKFKWDEGLCEAYEKFETPPTDGSVIRFHKHVYYFYGKDNKLKFSIQTELFASFGQQLKFDYVLGRAETTDGVYYHSTYSTLNYRLPMDYKKLKDDVFKILNNKVKPVTSSATKVKK